ncbi:ATP-dependent zinc metalloprotease FtsH [Polyangium aurulentum]|uniref:ATP-dependent zinc metalloprotease FtsH n=1 Tax=Polyangium aurulentum TaxID=2567896 RepID=UPI0010ADB9BF|nr:ATP-dependent zinc metalloprotease FtsH [Polyangium aurulentum]UQA62353.1 ATP-dependent zinc metalloprotease FtsH [Polyangium aurulentum]
MKQSHKTLLLWVLLIMMFLVIWQYLGTGSPPATQVPFSEFMTQVRADHEKEPFVESVSIKEREYTFWVKDPKNNAKQRKVTIGPDNADEITKTLVDNKVAVTFEKEDASPFWSGALVTILPMVFLLVMFYLFMRQLQAGGGKAMSFGKSRARLLSESQNKVTFSDVAGIDEAKDELEEIIAFLKDPKKFQKLGGRIPKGVLMMGPPGTGKTLLAKAIAGEAGVPFFSISGSDFVEMFVGVGASRVRDLFEQGKKHAPCIIFIDEIDAVGRHRGAGLGGGHDEREQTLNQLLVEMDGFESNEGVIIVAATNRPDVLDPAILRPGRFDRRIVVSRPDVRGREGILRVHTKKVPLGPDVDLEIISRGTPGFVGADLENLVNEAALLAARQDKDLVSMVDFEMAKDKVLMGAERRSMVISDEERKTTAFHEAGHALVAKLLEKNADPVHKVTIIPRGPALGITQQLPKEDRLSMSRDFAKARLAVLMGGRVAEEIVFGQFTTGAGNDIKQASNLARRMVTEFGMSDVIGPISYASDEESVFLGRDFTSRSRNYSETIANQIDDEVRKFVIEGHEEAKRLLGENRAILELLANALLERETLDAEEVDAIVAGRELPQRQKVVIPTYAEREKAAKEKRRAASIFGAPKPAPST